MFDDTYKTVEGDCEILYKEKGSKFLSYAYHVESQEHIKEILTDLRKQYYDATHHCYAWRLGAKGDTFRANDDGEPSGTAGKPILGQLLSMNITYTLVVVIRYFGGTKLGVSGLITAYKESAAEALAEAIVIEKTEDAYYDVEFGYLVMNDVMKVIKDEQPKIVDQQFDNLCRMRLAIRRSSQQRFATRILDVEGIKMDFIEYK